MQLYDGFFEVFGCGFLVTFILAVGMLILVVIS